MNKKVPFLDLRISDETERQELLSAVDGVFQHGRFILGPEVEELEKRVAEYCGRRYGVGVNSGTDALFVGLKSLGIGPGDEVVTTALSWIATANAVSLTGAKPVFADIGEDLNIDPDSVARLINSRTKVILPVNYTGKICRFDELADISDRCGVQILEDASQSFGATYRNRRAGSFGTVSAVSLNPMKVLGACGEAGIVLTDDPEIRDRLISLRYNGMVDREICTEPSLNGRIDTLQAAILLRRMSRFEKTIQKRREIARRYNEALNTIVETPCELDGQMDVYYTYTIRTDQRDELKAYLETRGIEAKVRDPFLMPDQPAYKNRGKNQCPNARRLVGMLLCIPAHEKMTEEDVGYVCRCVKDFFSK